MHGTEEEPERGHSSLGAVTAVSTLNNRGLHFSNGSRDVQDYRKNILKAKVAGLAID